MQSLPMLQHGAKFCSFLQPNIIPLCGWSTFYIKIYSSTDGLLGYSYDLLVFFKNMTINRSVGLGGDRLIISVRNLPRNRYSVSYIT